MLCAWCVVCSVVLCIVWFVLRRVSIELVWMKRRRMRPRVVLCLLHSLVFFLYHLHLLFFCFSSVQFSAVLCCAVQCSSVGRFVLQAAHDTQTRSSCNLTTCRFQHFSNTASNNTDLHLQTTRKWLQQSLRLFLFTLTKRLTLFIAPVPPAEKGSAILIGFK